MYARIHHTAIKVKNLEWYIHFFTEVFGMEIERTAGASPERKVWFKEGIQLNEEMDFGEDGVMDHIGIETDSMERILEKSKEYGCSSLPNGENWFQTPDGIRIELK